MDKIIAEFKKSGFEITDLQDAEANSRSEKLKSYLRRLGDGEDLEDVRADFVKEFSDVEASEIMRAEQELMKEGTPLAQVQKLCDIHSALFHGATREERIANAERAVNESLKKEKEAGIAAENEVVSDEQQKMNLEQMREAYTNKKEVAAKLIAINGHPLQTFTKENEALEELLEAARTGEKSFENADVAKIREVVIHYAKKGDLLYPLLKVRYGITGPSEVMWTVDDEIRDELSKISREEKGVDYQERLDAVLTRAEEMIYKEKNILFPICAVNFTEDEWKGIYQDSKDYAACFGVTGKVWEDGENYKEEEIKENTGEIVMPGGHLTMPQLTALLNTLPIEITFVDAENINRYFNEGPKVFKRPGMAIDREVFSCHPPKIEPMVRHIIDDFRNGVRDEVPVWMEKGGKTFLVKYMAVRDKEKNYIGTVEVVQDMEFAKEHFKEAKNDEK